MDDSKNKKSIGMLIMILALVLVAVILIVVIIASSGSSETTTQNPASSSTPTIGTDDPTGTGTVDSTGTPSSKEPYVPGTAAKPVGPTTQTAPESGKITVGVKDVYTGLVLNIDSTNKYSETYNILYKNEATSEGFTRINTKLPSVDNTHFLRTEALEALEAMIQTFDSVAGTNEPFQVRGYQTGLAAALDSIYVTGNVFKMYQLSAGGTLGLNYYNNKVELNGQMVTYDKWFAANAAKYGFVYLGLTGSENHAAGEFRYVGTVHAAGIAQSNGSLKDYIAAVKSGTLTSVTVGDETWKLVYKTVTEDVEIEVGKNATYTVSGDNMGGVIVAYTSAK